MISVNASTALLRTATVSSVAIELSVLAIVPAFRLVGLLVGPLVDLPDATWILGILAIPGAVIWTGLLGAYLLYRALLRGTPVLEFTGAPRRDQ